MVALPAQADEHSTAEVAADLVLINGDVYTSNQAAMRAQAFAVKDGKFIAVGAMADIRTLIGDETRVLDAEGKTVIPGLIDGHTHLLSGMARALGVDLTDIVSKDEWLTLIKAKVATLKPGEWVLGGGWNHALSDGVLPTRQMLDAVAPNNPVFLNDIDGHTTWVNTLALTMAGMTADTKVPDGGEIVLDPATGEPTGILKEGASYPIAALESYRAAIDPEVGSAEVIALANSHGITGAHDMSGGNTVYTKLAEDDKLTLRLWLGNFLVGDADQVEAIAALRAETDRRMAAAKPSIPGPLLTHGYIKLIVDGVLSTHTALMIDPYSDLPSADPKPITDEDGLTALVSRSHANGFPIAIHAIGDRGVQMTLNAFERVGHPDGMIRDRIEHIEVATPDDVARFKALDVAASMQPVHATCCVGDYVIDRIGNARMPNAYAWKRMLDGGVHLSLSSDWPTSPLNPFKQIAAAMARTTNMDGEMKPWDTGQTLTFEEALFAYTQATADLSAWGAELGSITPGKWADFVLLVAPVDTNSPDAVAGAQVEATYLSGQPVYQR